MGSDSGESWRKTILVPASEALKTVSYVVHLHGISDGTSVHDYLLADKMSIAFLLVSQSFEMLLNLKPDN